MFASLFSVFSAFLLGFFSFAIAALLKPTELLALAPMITSPTAGTVWSAGSNQTVSWKTDNLNVPSEAKNYTVTILLGFLANNSENLDYRHPLASQIPIMQGSVTIHVPSNTPYGTDYIIILIGDSGNASPSFTITN